MKRFELSALLLAGMLAVAGALTPMRSTAQVVAEHTMKSAADLQWADLPSLPPGAKFVVLEGPPNKAVPFTMRIRMPANYRIPAHFHPAVERVSVLSGALYMGMGEVLNAAEGMAVRAGGFAVMPVNSPHFAYTRDEPVEIQLHGIGPWGITYINPADDPRRKQQ